MSEREINILNSTIEILKDKLNPDKIILFGSRAKGKSKLHSDFDIAIEISKPDLRTRRIIKEKIDDVSGLYSVDLIYLNSVDENFKNLVLKTEKTVYER